MKSYKASCAKEDFVPVHKTKNGKYAIRYNTVESTEGEGEDARIIVTYDEIISDVKPTKKVIVGLIVRERYTDADELAFARQQYSDVEEYKEYNAYVEQCKKWACEALGLTYVPTYQPTQGEVMNQLRELLKSTVEQLPEAEAEKVPALHDPWKPGEAVAKGNRRYNTRDGKAYECIQPHTTQEGWEPDLTPAMWKVVHYEEWPEWVQPAGGHDAYKKGDKVSHNGKHWISDADDNVWEPGAYGWTEAN